MVPLIVDSVDFLRKKLALLGRMHALFSKATLFSLPQVFCWPQICQEYGVLRATTNKKFTLAASVHPM